MAVRPPADSSWSIQLQAGNVLEVRWIERPQCRNPDMTGWEEKDRFVTFRLAKLEPDAAWFGSLTYRRVGNDRLEIFLAIRDESGTVREEKFLMRRK